MSGTPEGLRIRSLAAMARALGRSERLERMIELAAEEARSALDAASVSVSRLEPGTGSVRTLINVGELGPDEKRWPTDEVYQLSEFGNLQLVVSELTTWAVRIDDPHADPREVQLLKDLGKGSAVGAPIIVDGVLWGEFYATRLESAELYGPGDVDYLQALVSILGGAISRAQREESLEQLAYRDPLTGLLNRRALDEQALTAFNGSADGTPVTIVMIDINGLKHVNDTQGHLVGDQLIKSVAGKLVRHFSGLHGSLVARVGGDEFTVLASGIEPNRVLEVADAFCESSRTLAYGAGVSCGAATARMSQDIPLTPTELFAAADRAQYIAKRSASRSTVLAPPELRAVG